MPEPIILLRDGPTGVLEKHPAIRNPFRQRVLKEQFDAIIKAYDARHKDIMRIDRNGRYRRHIGNGWATSFWRGFDGVLSDRWDAASRQSSAYACWRAGQALRSALPDLALSAADEPIEDDGSTRVHLYDPKSASPMPIAAQKKHGYDPAVDYKISPMPGLLLGKINNISRRMIDSVLHALDMEGVVLFCYSDQGVSVGHYVFGTAPFPVIGVDLEHIKHTATDIEREIETTIIRELARAWLEARGNKYLMTDRDQDIRDTVETFVRAWIDDGVLNIDILENYTRKMAGSKPQI